MIEEKQNEIISTLSSSDEIKRFKELESIIINSDKYKELIKEFDNNKDEYERNNILNNKIIELRKELFSIEEVKEYAKIESDIRLLSKKISSIISSVVDSENCKK